MHILVTHHYGKERHEAFKRRIRQYGVLCRSDYVERILSSFAHQIQSEYYGGNRSVFIVVIALENISASNQASLSLTSETVSNKVVFINFIQ